jgi:sulfopyruvate decarboxylase subunit beta
MTLYSKILDKCLEHGINFYTSLPCSYNISILKELKTLNDQTQKQRKNSFYYVPLVREESGVGLCAGASLGGAKTAMILQNQGLGNMMTQLFALNGTFDGSYAIPNLYIISHRGTEGEKIMAQKPLGRKTEEILNVAEIKHAAIKSASEMNIFENLLEYYDDGESVALLIKPKYNNPPDRMKSNAKIERNLEGCDSLKISVETKMSRYHAISIIMNQVKSEYVISNIGHPSRELHDIKDRERNFYLTSSLGQAYMVALGFALKMEKRDEKVIGFEGDGGILMNASSLALLAATRPSNLILVILDNGVYGSTGNVDTYASDNVNISALVQAYGFPKSKIRTISEEDQLTKEITYALNNEGPFLLHVLITDEYKKVPAIPLSINEVKNRFLDSISK